MPAPITFVASGVRREGPTRGGLGIPVPLAGRLKASVALTATRAAQDPDVRMEAVPGQDAVVVHIAGGPALWLHPEHARDLLRAQQDPWSVVGQTELRMYQSVSSGTVARNVSALVKEFESHFARVLSPQLWTSVYDNATFVLSKYVSRAGKREAEASQRLLDMLASLTGRDRRLDGGLRTSCQAHFAQSCEPAQALMRISEKGESHRPWP